MPDDGSGELLKDVCDLVIDDQDLLPVNGECLCHIGALTVAEAMGCSEFDTPIDEDPMTADEMILLMQMNVSGKWSIGSGSDAAIHALGGGLAFAAMTSAETGSVDGRICAVYPVGMRASLSLKHDVPCVADPGRQHGEEKASDAFPAAKVEPHYFLWRNQ